MDSSITFVSSIGYLESTDNMLTALMMRFRTLSSTNSILAEQLSRLSDEVITAFVLEMPNTEFNYSSKVKKKRKKKVKVHSLQLARVYSVDFTQYPWS